MPSSTHLISRLIFAAVVTQGCARARATQGERSDALPAQPLAFMAGRPLVILPVQHVSVPDSSGGSGDSARRADFLALRDPARRAAFLVTVDEQIGTELTARGLEKAWTFAPALVAAVRITGTIVRDPRSLSAAPLRRLVKPSDTPLGQPLASQIRSLAALRSARYVLLPVELRIDNRGELWRSALRTYLIDTRTSRIVWSGDVAATGAAVLRPGVADGIATALADLAVAQ